MKKLETVQAPTIENLGKPYVNPVTKQLINEQLADLKRKTALVEKQLLILKQENKHRRYLEQ